MASLNTDGTPRGKDALSVNFYVRAFFSRVTSIEPPLVVKVKGQHEWQDAGYQQKQSKAKET